MSKLRYEYVREKHDLLVLLLYSKHHIHLHVFNNGKNYVPFNDV